MTVNVFRLGGIYGPGRRFAFSLCNSALVTSIGIGERLQGLLGELEI